MEHLLLQYIIPLMSGFGYPIVILATICESIPILGLIVPGGIIVHLSGAFAQDAGLSIPILILVTIISAQIGDFIAFEFGRRYGEEFLFKIGPRFGFKEEYLFVTHRFCHQYGGLALMTGRFNNIVRPLVPLVIGSSQMSYWKFFAYSSLGCIAWSSFAVLIGYFARESWELMAESVGIIGGIIFAAIMLGGFFLIRYEAKKMTEEKKAQIRAKFLQKFKKQHPSHPEKKLEPEFPAPKTHQEYLAEYHQSHPQNKEDTTRES